MRTLNPQEAGWTHCHVVLLFHDLETKFHKLEVKMDLEDKDKTFTILGFGYVL